MVQELGGGADPEPNTSSSDIDAQLFAVLPFTVTLTYLALVAGIVYFSEFSVLPLLVLVNLVVNVVPSVDVADDKIVCALISIIPCNINAANVLSRS